VLADDHHAVGARHPPEARQLLRSVAAVQQFEDGIWAHSDMVVKTTTARQVPGGPFSGDRRSYQRPREKKPSSARTRMTIRMIQRMLT
jgi:hypothetical protein